MNLQSIQSIKYAILLPLVATFTIAHVGRAAENKEGNTDSTSLEAVIVTATKREAVLQDLPLTVQALTADTLNALGMSSVRDYVALVPGLSYIDQGSSGAKLTLRGLSTSQFIETQSTVGVYIDEMPITDAGGQAPAFLTAPDLRLRDVERVEILKGPQGTLFGAGSMGGTLRIITNAPDLAQFSGNVETAISSTDHGSWNYAVDSVLNLPIAPNRFAVRVLGYYEDNDGWINNLALGAKDINTDIRYGGRLSARLAATDALDVRAHVNLQKTSRGGFAAETLALGDFTQDRATVEAYLDDTNQFNLTGNYELSSATLVSSSSYVDRVTQARLDISRQLEPFLPGQVGQQQSTTTQREITQEIRLASRSDTRFGWIGGAYYSHLNRIFAQRLPAPGIDANFGGLSGGLCGETDVVFCQQQNVVFEEIAGFGEVSYEFTNQLVGTLGLRWFGVDIRFDNTANGFFNGGPTRAVGGGSDSGLLPKFNLAYSFRPDRLLYTTVSKGYRRGGVNSVIPEQEALCSEDLAALGLTSAPRTFDSDTVWNYEVGAKTSWLHDRLQVNADTYYTDWTGLPGTKILDCGFLFTENAGKARTKGLDLELQAIVAERLRLISTLSYTDAELTSDFEDLNGQSGDRAPGVPRYTWSLSAFYDAPLSGTVHGFATASYQHVGESFTEYDRTVAQRLTGFDLIAASVGVRSQNWTVSIFAENLTNERGILNAYNTPFADFVVRNKPRTLGIRTHFDF